MLPHFLALRLESLRARAQASPHPEGREPDVCLATAVQQLRRRVWLHGSERGLSPLSHQQRTVSVAIRASASFNVLTTVIHGGPLESRMSRWRIAVAICSSRSGKWGSGAATIWRGEFSEDARTRWSCQQVAPLTSNVHTSRPEAIYWILNTALEGCMCKRRSSWRA